MAVWTIGMKFICQLLSEFRIVFLREARAESLGDVPCFGRANDEDVSIAERLGVWSLFLLLENKINLATVVRVVDLKRRIRFQGKCGAKNLEEFGFTEG